VFVQSVLHEVCNQNKQLIFPGQTKPLGTRSGFNELIGQCYTCNWVVDIRDPINRPEYVLEYLARYTHRVAISNNRILALEDGRVSFAVKNRETQKTETVILEAVEFIRRFLLHVLPKGFMRIRHYGLFANRYKRDNVRRCRQLLGLSQKLPQVVAQSVQEMMLTLTGKNILLCPCCRKGTMHTITEIPEGTGPNAFALLHPSRFRPPG